MRILTRPLKAPTDPVLDFATLQFPLLASDKEDGIRGLICPKRGPLTGQMKPVPNRWTNRMLDLKAAHYLDGEIVAIDCEGDTADFNDTQSAIMTHDGQPEFEFRAFDDYENIYDPYEVRLKRCVTKVKALRQMGFHQFKWLAQTPVRCVRELEQREEDALLRGKEGLMLRDPRGWYKEGRSTFNEGYLLKVKRSTDDEARVIALEEEFENCNPATRNERGLQQRSKHRAGLKGKGCVGKLICIWRGKQIKIGSGLSQLLKQMWWDSPGLILNKIITFKYQRHGMKPGGLPRAPIFKSIRDPRA